MAAMGLTAVISPISLGHDGQTYNVNADDAASAIAGAMGAAQLDFISNVPGVLKDGQVIGGLTAVETDQLLQSASHPPLVELREQTLAPTDRNALRPWPPETDAPFQAIPDLPYFVGREAALADLQTRLRGGETVSICNLKGMGGVGKTALAAHLAYALRPYFPDGVLWARLDTTDTMSILSDFAAAYDEDVSQRHTIESRAAAVRSILADKRALIVLDNAETSGQVRPLLPPTVGETAVIITTRHDLAVTDGLHRAAVMPFDPAQQKALALFTHLLGEQRVRKEQGDLCTIADLLGQLPLALAIAAGRLRGMKTAVYLSQLEQADARLDALTREDRSVRLTFDVSYKALSSELQVFFAALGTFGGDDFGITAVAHVTETDEAMAKVYLDELVGLSLVQVGRNGRYQLHSLLKDYAQTHILSDNSWQRMVDYFLQFTQLYKYEYTRLTMEFENIMAGLETAFTQKFSNSYMNSVLQIMNYLEVKGLYDLADFHLNQAYREGLANDDTANIASILVQQGNIANKRGQYELSNQLIQKGIPLAKATNQQHVLTEAYTYLGGNAYVNTSLLQAKEFWETALTLAQKQNDKRLMVGLLNNLGMVAKEIGNLNQAQTLYDNALKLVEDEPFWQRKKILIINNLGDLAQRTGHYIQADACFRQVLDMAQQENLPPRICFTLINHANIALYTGDFNTAMAYYQKALGIARKIDSKRYLARALSSMGWCACVLDEQKQAHALLQESLTVSEQAGLPEYISASLKGLGYLSWRQNCFNEAEIHYQNSLTHARPSDRMLLSSDILILLGDLYLTQSYWLLATEVLTEALKLTQAYGYVQGIALALFGLAQTTAVSNPIQSCQHAEESYAMLQKMGHYKTATVAAWLQKSESKFPI